MNRRLPAVSLSISLTFALAGLGGCSLAGPASPASTTPMVKSTGIVHGGQQAVTGAVIQLYAVGNSGYGSLATPLISATVTTSDGTGVANSNANAGNANNTLPAGNFTITGDFTCPTPSTLVYLTATGGNPGLAAGTNNSALVLMAAIGQCGSLTGSTFLSVNEVTTVASIYALAQFAGASGSIGSVSSTTAGITNAFANVNNMVNIGTGVALTTTGGGNTVPQSTINTIADILVPCVNSTGPTSAACATLFSDATPSNIAPATTVLNAALYMALYPRTNVAALFGISTANPAFQPNLNAAPNNWDVVVSGGAQSNCGYSGSGYDVSGTVSYGGAKTGRIYLSLNNSNCSGGGTQGVSISAAGTYTIRAVPPGTYTLSSFMDIQGNSIQNAAGPSGSASVTVGSADVSAANVTLVDPATVTLTSAPNLQSVSGFNSGVIAQYSAIKNNGVESAASYTLQWSTTSSFTAIAGSQTFPANGTHTDLWLVNGLVDGSVYYFRAYGTSAGTPVSPYSSTVGPVTVGAPSTGSTVSGSVTFSGASTGPMYVGVYNQYTSAVYLQYIPTPVSSQAYSVVVPNSATAVYEPVAIVDQNSNGVLDAGDLNNVETNSALISITGATTNQNITLPTGNSIAAVTTSHYSSGTYGFNVQVNQGVKLPVAVTLLSSSNSDGANVAGPMDIALCSQNSGCGRGYQIGFNLGTTAPSVGDTYFLSVTYSDTTTETLTASVTAVLSNFATSLAPTTGSSVSTTPTFTWAAPVCAACSSYVYQFSINSTNGGPIWQVPGNANGLPYSTTSLVWGTDPTDGGNSPSPTSLTLGTAYTWSVTVVDTNNNQAITQAAYTP